MKIYPPLGYAPTYPRLMEEIYPYCEAHGVPVITHCSTATVRAKAFAKDKAAATRLADPDHYLGVLERFPKLRVCLAHFGGEEAWSAYLNDPLQEGQYKESPSGPWLSKILKIVRSGDYPNLFVDIAYVIFRFRENAQILKVLLTDPHVKTHTLFGTDFYMVQLKAISGTERA